MNNLKHVERLGQGLVVTCLVIGILGAVLTGVIHYRYGIITPLDLSGHGFEFYLLAGSAVLIAALGAIDLLTGFLAIRRMPKESSKKMVVAGMVLGVADLLPAILILTMVVGMFITRFFVLGQMFEF